VLDLIAAGAANKEIAAQLGVGQQAVKQQVSRLLARFDVESRSGLARLAIGMRITGQRASDLPLEYLFDRAPMAMAISSGPEHVIRAVNHAFVEQFGDRRGWVGLRLRDVLTPQEAPILPLIDAIYRSGRSAQRESAPIRWSESAGGTEERAMTVLITPTRDASGAVAGLVFFGLDVSEQIALRARLRSTEAAQHALAEQLPSGVGVIVTDRAGRPVVVAGPVRELIGGALQADVPLAAQAALHSLRWTETGIAIGPDDSPSVRALGGRTVSATITGRVPDGDGEYRLSVTARPLRGADSAITGAVVVLAPLEG
jgi:PAS domain-containing protein